MESKPEIDESTSDFNELADVRFELKKPKIVEQLKTLKLHAESIDSSIFSNDKEDKSKKSGSKSLKAGMVHTISVENDDNYKKDTKS